MSEPDESDTGAEAAEGRASPDAGPDAEPGADAEGDGDRGEATTTLDRGEDPASDDAEDVAKDGEGDSGGDADGDPDRPLRDIAADAVEVPSDFDGDTDPAEVAFEPAAIDVEDAFVERVAETDPEEIAVEIATLQLRVAALEGETADLEATVEDLESRLARKQADFQNYKQRQQRRLEEEKQRATEDLVERLLDVRDNLERALDQDEGADIRGGVESTLRQFDGELEREDVAVIDPEPGDETDPQHHEVLMRVESDQPEDTVADVHRAGYEMAGKVLRPAQVTVSDGSGADASAEDGEDAAENVGDAPDNGEDAPDDGE